MRTIDLSILCVTNNEHHDTERFIEDMCRIAPFLSAEFVLGLDREKAQKSRIRHYATKALDLTADKLQEDVLDQAIAACSGEWILRLDDDEKVSNALLTWLITGAYKQGNLYAFPRIYMYPDADHFIANEGMWPDLQTRLGKKELMEGYTYVHAGNPNGTGVVVPYAIEHHKLLVRDFRERQKIGERYEQCRPGAGTRPEYARYNLPELFYDQLLTKPYINLGNFAEVRK